MKESSSNISLFRSAIAIMQRDIFVYILSIATGVLIARNLGPDVLGIWVLLSLVSAYAESFGRLKTDIASVYFIGSKKAKEEEVLFSTTLYAVISSLLLTLLLLWNLDLLSSVLFKAADKNYTEQLFFIILVIPFEFLLLNYTYFYLALEKVTIYNRIKVLQSVINFVVIFGLIVIFKFNLWAVVMAKIAGVLITLFYCYLSIDRKNWINLRSRWNYSLNVEILKYAYTFYAIGILGNINRLTIKTLGASFLNTSQLAFYNQGESSGRFLTVIPNALATILYPRISGTEDKSQTLDISCQSFRLTLIVMSIAGVSLYVVANPLIVFLYGEVFAPTAEVLKLAIPGLVIGSSCLILKSYFEGKGDAGILPKLQIGPVILQIIFSYFLIQEFGLIGAAVSFSFGSALYGLVVFIAFVRINKLPYLRLAPQAPDIKLIYNILRSKLIS